MIKKIFFYLKVNILLIIVVVMLIINLIRVESLSDKLKKINAEIDRGPQRIGTPLFHTTIRDEIDDIKGEIYTIKNYFGIKNY